MSAACPIFRACPSGTHHRNTIRRAFHRHPVRGEFIGDLVWQLEGITEREERPWITRRDADLDAAGTRENLLRMIALNERIPEPIIVPAHDMRGFAPLPKLPQTAAPQEAREGHRPDG
jgi:hypothetical protein